jgi:demethylmenaquinone methyltransferase / 2-methoxy-6-polyprenyl-1,4-benzoquinol methylase
MRVTPDIQDKAGKKEQVGKMFDAIAFRYDLLNQLLSFGIHHHWRKKSIRLLKPLIQSPTPQLLDVATGTADFALDALSICSVQITGIDISADMLEIGRKKVKEKKADGRIRFIQADSESLPFDPNSFDAATVGFGVRNFENLEKGLLEISRVLKPGAPLAILEFSIPSGMLMKPLYRFYLSIICPLVGRMISGNTIAYDYLFRSVEAFPYGDTFKQILLKSGFSEVHYHPLTLGIVSVYVAKK